MIWATLVFSAIFAILFCVLRNEWLRILPPNKKNKDLLCFSIIVPVRNEAQNIATLLYCLAAQKYPREYFEVIIIDDFSEDDTMSIVTKLQPSLNINMDIFTLKNKAHCGKKYAITEGINSAQHNFILSTDADCVLHENWLSTFNNAFEESTKMVCAPVRLKGKTLFGQFQEIEFCELQGVGAVMIHRNLPGICNGANMGYRKDAFHEVGGYTENFNIPSGDDEFLLHKMMKSYPNGVKYLKSSDAIVTSGIMNNWRSFLNQRTRWVTKWKHHKSWKYKISHFGLFFDACIFYMGLIFCATNAHDLWFALSIIALRFISNYFYVKTVMKFLSIKASPLSILLFNFVYPLYVLMIGFISLKTNYTWKGRKFNV